MSVIRLVLAAAASFVFLGQTQAGVPSPCRPDVCADRPAPPALTQVWPAARRHAFARLLTAEAAFVAAVGTDETDRGGSAAGEAEMARDAEHAAFRHTLDAVAQGRAEIVFVDYAVSDAALNAAYRQVMAVDDPAALVGQRRQGRYPHDAARLARLSRCLHRLRRHLRRDDGRRRDGRADDATDDPARGVPGGLRRAGTDMSQMVAAPILPPSSRAQRRDPGPRIGTPGLLRCARNDGVHLAAQCASW